LTGAAVLDTDVFSFVLKGDSRAGLFKNVLNSHRWCLSFMSAAELRCWAVQHGWGARKRDDLEAHLRRCLMLMPDDAMIREWARITAHRAKRGRAIGCGDAWIAATAVRFGLPLVTHNRADFAEIPGLVLAG
jgi:tRNA(fMet)-specific endonuclease VapC